MNKLILRQDFSLVLHECSVTEACVSITSKYGGTGWKSFGVGSKLSSFAGRACWTHNTRSDGLVEYNPKR